MEFVVFSTDGNLENLLFMVAIRENGVRNFMELQSRDPSRHARILKGYRNGAIDFQVAGNFDPNITGLYFAKRKLGSAATELSMPIDTSTDLTWVTCNPCDNCPKSTEIGIHLNSYDPTSSTIASLVPCLSDTCASLVQSGSSSCSVQSNQCIYYHLKCEDGSRTSCIMCMTDSLSTRCSRTP